MSFEPLNDLERSLVRAATDPAHRPQFYKDLVQSDIFIIQHGEAPPQDIGQKTLEEGTQLKIANIEYDGKPYIPIFSSLQRLQATLTNEVAYLGINTLEFLKITLGADLLLNPGSDYGKEITAAEAASIVDGSLWQPNKRITQQKAAQVLIGQPKNYPTELVDALTRLFKKDKRVKRAWVAHFFNPEHDEKPHTLIAVDVSSGFDEISPAAGIVVRNVKIPDPPVDFLEITGRGGLEDYFVKDTQPFYTRKFLGLF